MAIRTAITNFATCCLAGASLSITANAFAPYGAENTDTSSYALGTYVWNVFFVQSEDSSTPWTTSKINDHKNRITQAAQWWETQAQNRFAPGNQWLDIQLNFVEVDGEDIVEIPDDSKSYYFDDILRRLNSSYTSTSSYSLTRTYNNDMRERFDTDWSFTSYIRPYTGRASAYVNGPYTNGFYDDSYHTYKHEMGHIFGARDEYASSNQHTGVQAGYLYAYNTNAEKHEDGSYNNNFHTALMNRSSSHVLSEGTIDAVGWTDTDNDDIPDILDTFPTLENIIANAYEEGIFKLSFDAHVTPLTSPNPFMDDITINTLSAAQYSLDGEEWIDMSTFDYAWGDYEETVNFQLNNIIAGDHIFDLRVYNSVGNYSEEQFTFTTIPEPASFILLGVSGLLIMQRKKRNA
ncbi:hypothetical protein JD969_01575 [Planctomycetota bacterium]|nr:hypothetical protein JD969_01575 [Planctomycetota bacterium]